MGGADSGAKRAAKPNGVTNFAVSTIRREGGGCSPRSQALLPEEELWHCQGGAL